MTSSPASERRFSSAARDQNVTKTRLRGKLGRPFVCFTCGVSLKAKVTSKVSKVSKARASESAPITPPKSGLWSLGCHLDVQSKTFETTRKKTATASHAASTTHNLVDYITR
jgi:hypothetical protein